MVLPSLPNLGSVTNPSTLDRYTGVGYRGYIDESRSARNVYRSQKKVNPADRVASDASWRSATYPEWLAELQENVDLQIVLKAIRKRAGI